eukprot:5671362-Amphidinium_carterae.1
MSHWGHPEWKIGYETTSVLLGVDDRNAACLKKKRHYLYPGSTRPIDADTVLVMMRCSMRVAIVSALTRPCRDAQQSNNARSFGSAVRALLHNGKSSTWHRHGLHMGPCLVELLGLC